MGILDTLFGRSEPPGGGQRPVSGTAAPSPDELALARYRYMLQTAPPQTLEQAHAEAFATLTPGQRAQLLQQLSAQLPEAERSATAGTLQDDPAALARLATRAEVRQPGTLERSFSGLGGRGGGVGGMVAGSLLGGIAGAVIGSAIAQSFFSGAGDAGAGDAGGGDAAAGAMQADGGADMADAGDDGDFDGGDFDDV